MRAKHTPGPWRVEQWSYADPRRAIPTIQNDKDAIAQVLDLWCMDDRAGEAAANARLIAAAPDAVELARAILNSKHILPESLLEQASDFLTKATGE